MGLTPKMGLTEADGYFAVDDIVIQDAIRQVADNMRDLRKEVLALKQRGEVLESEKDTDLL